MKHETDKSYNSKIHRFLLDKTCAKIYFALVELLRDTNFFSVSISKSFLQNMIGSKDKKLNTCRKHLKQLEEFGLIKRLYLPGNAATIYTIRTTGNFDDPMFPSWDHDEPDWFSIDSLDNQYEDQALESDLDIDEMLMDFNEKA